MATVIAVIVLLVVALRLRLGKLRAASTTGPGLSTTGRGQRANTVPPPSSTRAGAMDQAVQEHMRALVRSLEERASTRPRPGRTADEAAAEAGRPFPATRPGWATPPAPSTT